MYAAIAMALIVGAGCGELGGPNAAPPNVTLGSLKDVRPATVIEMCGTAFDVNATYSAVAQVGRQAPAGVFADAVEKTKKDEALRGFDSACQQRSMDCSDRERGWIKLGLLRCVEMPDRVSIFNCTRGILPQLSEKCRNAIKTLSHLFY
jgi:hypothetical protein